jgi:hypothetical protein
MNFKFRQLEVFFFPPKINFRNSRINDLADPLKIIF